MGATSGQQFIGGTYGPGFSFPPGSYIEGATIIAPSVVGEGSYLINVTFECNRNAFGKCSAVRSTVLGGVTMTGGYAFFADFDSTGVWSGVVDGGNTTPPGCVDCSPRGEVGGLAGGVWDGQTVVTPAGNLTPLAFCQGQQSCDNAGQIVLGSNCTVAIGNVKIIR